MAVHLSIFNILGEKVAVLLNGEQDATDHEVKCDGSGLSSGVCFYRIEAGSFVQTRKFVIVK